MREVREASAAFINMLETATPHPIKVAPKVAPIISSFRRLLPDASPRIHDHKGRYIGDQPVGRCPLRIRVLE